MKINIKIIRTVLLVTLVPMSISGCFAAAAGAGAEAAYVATQEDRTASETLNDQRITASIKTKMLADTEVSGLNINVDTHKSVVTLRGFVDTRAEADKAIEIAQGVSGVKQVQAKLIPK